MPLKTHKFNNGEIGWLFAPDSSGMIYKIYYIHIYIYITFDITFNIVNDRRKRVIIEKDRLPYWNLDGYAITQYIAYWDKPLALLETGWICNPTVRCLLRQSACLIGIWMDMQSHSTLLIETERLPYWNLDGYFI